MNEYERPAARKTLRTRASKQPWQLISKRVITIDCNHHLDSIEVVSTREAECVRAGVSLCEQIAGPSEIRPRSDVSLQLDRR
jgi:hypothetical protein